LQPWNDNESSPNWIEIAEECLQQHTDNHPDDRTSTFIHEQLKMTRISKYTMRYSPALVIFSYILYSASDAAHKILLEQNVLCHFSKTASIYSERKIKT